MKIAIDIRQDLWRAIEKNYENDNYYGAILDAMHLLTETIRNKTGLEGDGGSLVGQAFGSENPKIQLNKLQTDSEKDIQKGTQEILKGFYTAIRNPRSHDKIDDKQPEANAIITFINYILNIIDNSKLSFEEDAFLERVFDKYYVRTEEYSNLLVHEVPKRQRASLAISIILQRKNGDIYSLAYFMKSLFSKLEEVEITRVYNVISEELKFTSLNEDIRTILHICPPHYWHRVDKAVRLRIENILLEEMRNGEYDEDEGRLIDGALCSWIAEQHFLSFDNISLWTKEIMEKINKGGTHKAYIDRYFWSLLCIANRNDIHYTLADYIIDGLENKDEDIINKLKREIMFEEEHPWWRVFKEEIEKFTDIKYEDISW